MEFRSLARELKSLFRKGVGRPPEDEPFNELALRVFRYQCSHNSAYAGFVQRRGVEPHRVTRWEEIPHLPTRAFKAARLVSGDPDGVERVFRTSGTTGGREMRGEHHVLDLSLYRGSLLPNFRAHLLSDRGDKTRILCLVPSPETHRDSSLSFMMGEVVTAEGDENSGFFVERDGRIDRNAFRGALLEAEREGRPVLVVGTAFSFVRWTELARELRWEVSLPRGSGIMETGGYKGRSRVLTRGELHSALDQVLGVPGDRVVSEYGMTELLSQFYDLVLKEAGSSEEAASEGLKSRKISSASRERFHRGPPWTRTRVLHPLSLEPLGMGETGVLAHLDLANLGSVAAVLTEDMGRLVPGGFQLAGRSPGSEPRGCSLAMEDFLTSREEES